MPREFVEKDVVLSNGLAVHYHEWPGNGPAMVLLHPTCGYGRIWEWLVDEFGDRFHIYAPDQRGHGRTADPDGDYSAQEYAEDANLLMEHLGIEKAIIVGHSLGGRVAQVFSSKYPERVLATVLMATHVANFYQTTESVHAVMQDACGWLSTPASFANRQEVFAFMRGRRPFINDPDAALEHRIDHNFVLLEDGRLAPRYDITRVAQGLVYLMFNMRPFAARVECPVLLLRASLGASPSRAQAEEIAKCWKNAEVVDVEGHYALQLENPAGTAAAIMSFLSGAGVI